jgi:hypothetical protein
VGRARHRRGVRRPLTHIRAPILNQLRPGEQLTAIDGLDTGRRGGPEQTGITLATFGRLIPED